MREIECLGMGYASICELMRDNTSCGEMEDCGVKKMRVSSVHWDGNLVA